MPSNAINNIQLHHNNYWDGANTKVVGPATVTRNVFLQKPVDYLFLGDNSLTELMRRLEKNRNENETQLSTDKEDKNYNRICTKRSCQSSLIANTTAYSTKVNKSYKVLKQNGAHNGTHQHFYQVMIGLRYQLNLNALRFILGTNSAAEVISYVDYGKQIRILLAMLNILCDYEIDCKSFILKQIIGMADLWRGNFNGEKQAVPAARLWVNFCKEALPCLPTNDYPLLYGYLAKKIPSYAYLIRSVIVAELLLNLPLLSNKSIYFDSTHIFQKLLKYTNCFYPRQKWIILSQLAEKLFFLPDNNYWDAFESIFELWAISQRVWQVNEVCLILTELYHQLLLWRLENRNNVSFFFSISKNAIQNFNINVLVLCGNNKRARVEPL